MKKQLFRILRKLFRFAALITPTNRRKISFISAPDFTDNSMAMYCYCHEKHPELELVWLLTNQTSNSGTPKQKNFHRKNSLRGVWEYLTSAVVFTSHGSYFFAAKGGPFQVSLWHGMPIKNVLFLDNREPYEVHYADASIATSQFFQKKISQSFRIEESRVWITGLPRNDSLLTPSEDAREKLFKFLDLEDNLSLIFWLPTFRKASTGNRRVDSSVDTFMDEWPSDFWNNLNKICHENKVSLIIKLHPLDILNQRQSTVDLTNIKTIIADTWNDLNIDLYEALSLSSALITDVSSVCIDYIITKKPIAITKKSITNYNRGYIEELEELTNCFYNIENTSDFYNFISSHKNWKNAQTLPFKFYAKELADNLSCQRVLSKVQQASKLSLM